jgi:glycosyltransferase involved in cell wall biosynthesis
LKYSSFVIGSITLNIHWRCITTEAEDSKMVRGTSIIKLDDVDGLARALNGLVGDEFLRRKLGEETLARVRSLMRKDIYRQIMKIVLGASDKLKDRR